MYAIITCLCVSQMCFHSMRVSTRINSDPIINQFRAITGCFTLIMLTLTASIGSSVHCLRWRGRKHISKLVGASEVFGNFLLHILLIAKTSPKRY